MGIVSDRDAAARVAHFYDLGSPFYLALCGPNIHDGYYATGRESATEAREALTSYLAGKARVSRGMSVLDVGCGVGGSSIWLARNKGAVTTGITISAVQLDIARRLAREAGVGSAFLLMDATDMRFERYFDIVWALAMMTHLRNQAQFLEPALGLLPKRGRIVIFDWMLGTEGTGDDPLVRMVADGMVLASLHTLNTYLDWLTARGCRITYAEDLTDRTIKTWDDALALMRDPSSWRLALHASPAERAAMMPFLKTVRPMKRAMERGLIISGAIVAEKQS